MGLLAASLYSGAQFCVGSCVRGRSPAQWAAGLCLGQGRVCARHQCRKGFLRRQLMLRAHPLERQHFCASGLLPRRGRLRQWCTISKVLGNEFRTRRAHRVFGTLGAARAFTARSTLKLWFSEYDHRRLRRRADRLSWAAQALNPELHGPAEVTRLQSSRSVSGQKCHPVALSRLQGGGYVWEVMGTPSSRGSSTTPLVSRPGVLVPWSPQLLADKDHRTVA